MRIQCLVITSYIYTLISVCNEDGGIIEQYIIKNIEFQKMITDILDLVKNKYFIENYILFNGPAPLLSLRATLSFFKGIYYAFKKTTKIVIVGGNKAYWYDDYDIIVIQNFGGRYTLLLNANEWIEINQNDLAGYLKQYKRVGWVIRENGIVISTSSSGCILFPSLSFIISQGIKLSQENQYINDSADIIIYKNNIK